MFVVSGGRFCTQQVFLGNVGELEMDTALFEIGKKQVDQFFKIVVVKNKLFVYGDIRNGGAAAYSCGVGRGDGVQQRGEPFSVMTCLQTLFSMSV